MIHVGTLPDGARGFDANTRVTRDVAKRFWDHGYRFAVRYVRRSTKHDYDLSVPELVGLLNAGLAVMVVQHVAAEGWTPSEAIGRSYGAIAAEETRAVGVPAGVTVWCDLEGVAAGTPANAIIGFCNAWFDSVKGAGFDAGLYVGYGCGLTAQQLYYSLRFRRFWGAYNVNADTIPAVRGFCMRQGPYPPASERVSGVPFEYDTDQVMFDHFNNLPNALLPSDPG